MNNISFAGIAERGEDRRSSAFEIICSGSGEIVCGQKKYLLKSGQVIIIPPLTAHSVISGKDVKIVTLEKALLPIKAVTAVTDEHGGITNAIDTAIYFFNSENPKKDIVLSALGDLLSAFVSAFSDVCLSPAVALVKRDIENNLSDSLYALDAYIKSLPLNYDYVRKLFKKETGLTPHEYLVACRMKAAAGILSGGVTNNYTNYSISQVAEVCGYSEPLYFSRVFKKYFGVSPSDYLKKRDLS